MGGDREIPSPDRYLDAVFGAGGYLSSAFRGYTPRTGQVALARAVDHAIRERRHLLAEGPTGCHAAGQGVLMFNGMIRRVEDVLIGESLMGPDGEPRRVLGLARGTDEMIDVCPVKGAPWRVNQGHILTLVRTDTGQIKDVAIPEYRTWSTTQKHLYKLFRSRVDHFGSELSRLLPLSSYFVGVMLGDGTLSHDNGVTATKPDPEIFGAMQDEAARFPHLEAKTDGLRHSISGGPRNGRRRNPILTALRYLGVIPIRGEDRFVPLAYKTGPRATRLGVLAGLIDTDGGLSCGGHDFLSKSKQLADDVAFLARSLGFAAYVRPRECTGFGLTGIYWRTFISGDVAQIPCRIPRKQAEPRRQIKDVLRTGFALAPTGTKEPFYGFTLDGDGRFLLDDFTVTHNTGKSLAYAVPASYHAAATGKPVIIVTANIALQEQIVNKDLPLLRSLAPWDFTYALLKGRNNYLCEDKRLGYEADVFTDKALHAYNRSGADSAEEKRQLAIVRDWAADCAAGGPEEESGDVSDLPFEPLHHVWKRFSVSSDECKKSRCRYKTDCFANVALERARGAKVIVTNYHMLFAHISVFLATGVDLVLPSFEVVVLDEAHKAADIARDFFGFKISGEAVKRLGRKVRDAAPSIAEDVDRAATHYFHAMGTLKHDAKRYRARVTGDFVPDEIEAWLKLGSALESVATLMNDRVREATRLLEEIGINGGGLSASAEEAQDELGEAERDHDRCLVIRDGLTQAMTPKEHTTNVFFLDEDEKARISVCSKFVHPSEVLTPALFLKHAVTRTPDGATVQGGPVTVIATSATLATNGTSFDYISAELGVPRDHDELVAASPFDWPRQCLFIVPHEMPEPNAPEFRAAVASHVERTILLAGGRTLALFTSRKVLEQTYDAIVGTCRRNRITVLKQGDEPRTKLIERFKSDVTSVLLGTESFWAGVDVPGEACSVVIIDRLPFPTPDDPVLDVLSASDDKWFFKYSVPRAMIQLKQGFGRLVRSLECRGVVVCLDQRLSTKRYGRDFLRSLPPVPKSTRLEALVDWLKAPPPPPPPPPLPPPAAPEAWDAL